jgi:hypothetical protein
VNAEVAEVYTVVNASLNYQRIGTKGIITK